MDFKFAARDKTNAQSPQSATHSTLLQRTCSCGNHAIGGVQCASCNASKTGPLDHSIVNEKPVKEVPLHVREVLRSSGAPLDQSVRAAFESRLSHDFSRVRVHADDQAAASAKSLRARAYTMGDHIAFAQGRFAPRSSQGQQLLHHELTHVAHQAQSGVSLQRYADNDKDEPAGTPTEATPTQKSPELPGGTPSAEPLEAKPPTGCTRNPLANSITASDKRLGGQKVEASLGEKEFGNTSKLGADFRFGACKMGGNWRFHLDALVVPIANKVQPITFRKNIAAAADAEVTQTTYQDIVRDLSPTARVTFSVSCGATKANDAITTYSRRDTYWKQQFVIDHEDFHVTDWIDKYKPELVTSENEVLAHSIPEADATDAAGAVSKANKELTNFMASAYGRVCAAFVPQKESRAYDKGAPAYQKLVDDIKARAVTEKW